MAYPENMLWLFAWVQDRFPTQPAQRERLNGVLRQIIRHRHDWGVRRMGDIVSKREMIASRFRSSANARALDEIVQAVQERQAQASAIASSRRFWASLALLAIFLAVVSNGPRIRDHVARLVGPCECAMAPFSLDWSGLSRTCWSVIGRLVRWRTG